MEPYALEPEIFSKRIPEIDAALSATIYKDLVAVGMINTTGFSRFPPDTAELDIQ